MCAILTVKQLLNGKYINFEHNLIKSAEISGI